MGPPQVWAACRRAGVRRMGSARVRLCGGDPRDHARLGVSRCPAANRLGPRLAPGSAARRGAPGIPRAFSDRLRTRSARTSLLVPLRVPLRCPVLFSQYAAAGRAQGRAVVYRLRTLRRDLPFRRRTNRRLHHPNRRLRLLPNLRRRLPVGGDPLCRAVRSLGLRRRTFARAADAFRRAHRSPWLPRFGNRGRAGGGSRHRRSAIRSTSRSPPARLATRPTRASAGERARTRVPRALHPLRRMLPCLPERLPATSGIHPRPGRPLDAPGGGRLVGLRSELQPLRPSLPDRRDTSPAARRKTRGAHWSGGRRPRHMSSLCRPG